MKIVVRFFAVIGFLITLLIVAGVVIALNKQADTTEPGSVILTLDFDRSIAEQAGSSALDLALNDEPKSSLLDIVHAIDKARIDPHVKGIAARFGSTQPGFAQSQEIRAALARFRQSGKFTYAYASSYGGYGMGNRSYYLASAFENIWVQPVGTVSLTGLAIESPFAKGVLDKLGVGAQFLQREEYKSFMETFTRDAYSPPVKSEMQTLVNELSDQIATGIAESRGWDVAHAKELMQQGPYVADEALKSGLVTRIAYRDELDDEFKQKAGADVKFIGAEDYLSFDGHKKTEPQATKIAIIYGVGMIVDRAPNAGGLSTGDVFSADDVADAFQAAADDETVKAIIFRVNSPGGSPEASETVRRALVHAKIKGKIVVVSMGDTAASGGYWVAMNADKIIAEPGTLTGSIGVIGGKFFLSGLAQKIGVTEDIIKTDDNAGMWSMMHEFSPAQLERVNALMDQTYHAFVFNVAEARKIPLEKMPDIAKGHVWTGAQAAKNGLVDELGGFDVALGSTRTLLKLTAEDPIDLEEYPVPLTPAEKIMKLLKGFGVQGSLMPSILAKQLGISSVHLPLPELLLLQHNPVAVLMPSVMINTVQ